MKLTVIETARALREQDDYVILTHLNPDGDTLGSAALLCRGLQAAGKKARILHNPQTTPKLAFLTQGLCCDGCEAGQHLILVDVAAEHLLPQDWRQGSYFMRLDHHGGNPSFTEFELVQPETASCGEVVYEVLLQMGVKLDKAMAEALYTALSTDTGCFRYANTTAHTFCTAAACMDAGADVHSLNQRLFETNSLRKLQAQAYLTGQAQFVCGGAGVVCALPYRVHQELGLTEDDLDNISGFPRSIEGVKMAATLRQQEDGSVKISVRTVPGYDATKICAPFGGGGHKGAAGAKTQKPLEQVAEQIAELLGKELFTEGAL